jgi:hypothetical protein
MWEPRRLTTAWTFTVWYRGRFDLPLPYRYNTWSAECAIYVLARKWVMSSDVTHLLIVHLGIILILVLGFYSGLSGRVRTMYLFTIYVVSLLSSSNFLRYLVFHFFISLSTVVICRSSWILWLFMYKLRSEWIEECWIESDGGFRCWNWRLSPMAEFHRSMWVWTLKNAAKTRRK